MAVDDSARPQRLPDLNPAFSESSEPSVADLSTASVRRQLQVLGVARQPDPAATARSRAAVPSGDAESPAAMAPVDATPATSKPPNSSAIIEEWTAFHAQRRGNAEAELALESPKAKSSKSFDSIESLTETGSRTVQPSPELRTLMNAQKMRSQSLPLNFRSAEETAARVINEQADEYLEEDLEMYEVRDGGGGGETMAHEHDAGAPPRCFSPVWRSPKWVKALASPLSSRNRVFPSRSKDTDVRKRSRSKRGARLDSSDWGFKDAAHGGSSPLWRSRAQGSLRRSTSRTRSMFSWLQDAESKQHKNHDQEEQLTSSSSSSLSTDSWLRDLTTVGHLHEIAEELEIVEESSEDEEAEEPEKPEEAEEEEEEMEDLGDVSSFGKFLLQAAQRHPNARLTRLVSVSSSQRL